MRIVAADRRQDDEEQILRRRMHAQHRVRGDDGGTNVQCRTRRRGDPVLFDLQKLVQAVQYHLFVDLRDAHALRRTVHPLEVLFGTENADLALRVPERLQALENALRIMKYRRRQVEGHRAVRLDDRLLPRPVFILHREHVVGEDFAETQLAAVGRFCLEVFRFDEFHNPHFLLYGRTRLFFLILPIL